MPTIIDGMQLTTSSNSQMLIYPPTPSNIPPMAPPTPSGVPAPFPHKGNSGTVDSPSSKLKVGGGKSVIEDNHFDVDPPGNNPSNPCPIHDLTTGVINKKLLIG